MDRLVKRNWRGGTRGGGFGNRFFVRLATSRFGRFVAPFFVFWVALYFLVTWSTARRASGDFAERVGRGGSRLRRLAFTFSHFRNFGLMLFDRLAFLGGGASSFTCDIPDWNIVEEHRRRGLGVIMVSAHQGNWEIMGQTLAQRSVPVTLLMHDGIPASARAALENINMGRSFRVLFTDGSPASVAAILSEIREGRVIGIMGDRLFGGRGVAAPFLGDMMKFPIGPYVLARAVGASVLHAFAERVAARHYVFHCHAEPSDCQAGPNDARIPVDRRVAAFAARLEELVRRRPEQWGNFYDVWKDALV